MPRVMTEIASPYGRNATPAAGLHDPARRKTYLFADFKSLSGRQRRNIVIGRAGACDIRIRDRFASSKHIMLAFESARKVVVHDLGSTNGVYLDGQRMCQSFYLAEGMQLRLGDAHLFAVDRDGYFPIAAKSLDEFLREAAKVYGNNKLAGERVGVSRETVRRRFLRLLRTWSS